MSNQKKQNENPCPGPSFVPDDKALAVPADLAASLGLLTRLPIRVDTARAVARGARAAWAWPLAGVCVNALAALLASLVLWTGLPPAIAAVILIATQIVVTGAMHEDGLADSVDGLWGGWDRAKRLAIMKDSQIGTYGVLALGMSLLLRWQLWTLLLAAPQPLWAVALATGAISRVPMVALARALPPARDSGLGRSVGRPGGNTLALAIVLAACVAAAGLGFAAVPVILATTLTTTLWALIARAKIGGQTGDILGAAQQIAEITTLLTLAALI
ncbi:MAG: adenosylcobinamide-GDP ribazoletransferase [Alphaproteobacteria bacterium]|nr:adenosylcobinamide-GDP ribazoletransferase [Alphaproteobacteria bacterium]